MKVVFAGDDAQAVLTQITEFLETWQKIIGPSASQNIPTVPVQEPPAEVVSEKKPVGRPRKAIDATVAADPAHRRK